MSKNKLTIVPLGPGDPGLLTMQAVEALRGGNKLYLRTARHGIVSWLEKEGISYTALDGLYEEAETFEALYDRIAKELVKAASREAVLYGVADPLMDESVPVVVRSSEDRGISVQWLPGVSAGGACLPVSAAQQTSSGYRVCPARAFAEADWNPSESILITEVDTPILAGEIKLKLLSFLDGEQKITFFPPGIQTPRKTEHIALYELDRQKKYNETVCVFLPGMDYPQRDRFCFRDLEKIMARLRARDGCPWDNVQTHASLRPYMVEEAWEAVDAIERDDMAHLADELGDVLLQVVFHASIGESFDEFTMTDVISNICRKMIQRHPFLFGDEAERNGSRPEWEEIKRKETGSRTVGESLNDVSTSLPSLKYAIKVCKKLAQLPAARDEIVQPEDIRKWAGQIVNPDGTVDEEAMGRLLILCMEYCRRKELDGEILLHGAVTRMKEQYQALERERVQRGLSAEQITAEELKRFLVGADE